MCSYFHVGVERQYKVCKFGLKEEICWSLKQTCWLPHVCSPAVALLHTKGPCHRRKICVNSPWLYSYFTQTSLSKNKSINYIFIYLWVLRCLSSGTICDTIMMHCYNIKVLYSHEQLYIHTCMQKHNDSIKMSGHSSLEKYTSHFTERVVCERELETEQNCNILTPTLMAITTFLSCSPGLLN